MLTAFLVSVGIVFLLVVPTDAISCYKYVCGISTEPSYTFNESCVDPFSTVGKAKCNGTQCLTQWYFSWHVQGSKNLTISAVSRLCATNFTDPPLLPIVAIDECEGISRKYTLYKGTNFSVHDDQCYYQNYDSDIYYSGGSTTQSFCLTDNCNDKAYRPEPSANGVGALNTEITSLVVIAIATFLMSAKFSEMP